MSFNARASFDTLVAHEGLDWLLEEARAKNPSKAASLTEPVVDVLEDARRAQESIDAVLQKRAESRAQKVAAVRHMLYLCSRLDPA